MKQEIKDRWVAALRSGEYEQGTGRLRRKGPSGDKLCCLGVLCELAVEDGVIPPPVKEIGQEAFYRYGASREYGHLPDEVMDWAGLTSINPAPLNADESLAGLNDIGQTFAQIADLIEAGL